MWGGGGLRKDDSWTPNSNFTKVHFHLHVRDYCNYLVVCLCYSCLVCNLEGLHVRAYVYVLCLLIMRLLMPATMVIEWWECALPWTQIGSLLSFGLSIWVYLYLCVILVYIFSLSWFLTSDLTIWKLNKRYSTKQGDD